MAALTSFLLGDQALAFALAVTLTVGLASSVAWLVARPLSGRAALRHLILFAALICCLASPVLACFWLATGLSLVSIPILRDAGRPAGQAPLNDNRPVSDLQRPPTADRTVGTGPGSAHLPDSADRANASASAIRETAASSRPSTAEWREAGGVGQKLTSLHRIVAAVMLIWSAGALLMLARLARNVLRVVRLRRSSQVLQNAVLESSVNETAARLEMRQSPLLLTSPRNIAPVAIGFGRPAVVVPQRLLASLSNEELNDILLHELAHLKRHDQWIVLLEELAAAWYWPIVSIHVLNHALRVAREEICDNFVLASRDAIGYGNTLLHVAELLVGARPLGATVGIVGARGKLERRIAGLLHARRSKVTTTSRKAACCVTLLFVVLGVIASATWLTSAASEASDPPEAAAAPSQKLASTADPDDPTSAGHFRGRVTGPDGKPLSGARVFMARFYDRSSAAGPARATTDAEGRFEFDAPDMTYTTHDGLAARREGLLIVTKEGYAPDWLRTWGHDKRGIHEYWDPVKGAALDLQLATNDVPIHGRFLGPDGRPLAGARVRLADLMIPRNRDLDAHLAHWSKASVTAGFLTKVPDYKQELWHRPDLVPGLTIETRTDADGRFALSGLGRDRLAELSVTAPSIVDTTLTVMTRDAPDVGTFLDFAGKPTQTIYGAGFTVELKAGLTIKGRVIDRDSREPIAGMWIGPRKNALNDLTPSLYPWRTDENGRFAITGLDPVILTLDGESYRTIVAAATPGLPYQTTWVVANGKTDVLIECPRGIPFRLKVVDENGAPVEAAVTYVDIQPNASAVHQEVIWPVSQAARRPDGTYDGFVLPGPGAVLVKTKSELNYRPACVDAKAFFAPGKTDWTAEERISAYGTQDILTTCNGRYVHTVYRGPTLDQRDYSAIVLVNPAPDSGPLELAATVVRDRPRRVSLVDEMGEPVEDAVMQETIQWTGFVVATTKAVVSLQTRSTKLRAASFALSKLHPDRAQHITFVQDDRQLIGLLLARGDSDEPYTVHMQRWGAIVGRIVNENGEPLSGAFIEVTADGEESCERVGETTDADGRFLVTKVIPGLSYSGKIYAEQRFVGAPFEKLVLRAGEERELGEIRTGPSETTE